MPEVRKQRAENVEQVSASDVVVESVKKLVAEGFTGPAWRSLTALPTDTRFEAQHEEEKVLLLMRQHPIKNLPWVAVVALLIGVPVFWGEFPLIVTLTPLVQLSLAVVWYMGLAFFALERILLWFYNVYIVTDERIIDVDFFGLLYKNVNVTQIRKIQDVNYSQVGIFASFFNYGNVIVETSAAQKSDDRTEESSAFTFEGVSNPDRVVKVISELMEQEEREQYEGRTR
jgi:uncharacterized membrane protein YfbV (UPF0208 family)